MVGVPTLVRELRVLGIAPTSVLAGSGVTPGQLMAPQSKISRRQRLVIYRNATKLSALPQLGLVAGVKQRLSDFGIYGYAFASCDTIGDAIGFSLRNMALLCPLFQVKVSYGARLRRFERAWVRRTW